MMSENGVTPDAYVFNTLIVYYGAVKDKDMTRILLEVMEQLEVTPDDHTASLIKTHFPNSKSVNNAFYKLCDSRNVIFPVDSTIILETDLTIQLSYYDNEIEEKFDDQGNPVFPPELYAQNPDIFEIYSSFTRMGTV